MIDESKSPVGGEVEGKTFTSARAFREELERVKKEKK
jgi:hypothetical protein